MTQLHSDSNFLKRFLSAAVLALAASACASAAPVAGESAPDFAGRTYDGQPVSLAAYRGKVVVLSFWASWCGPCQKELPILEGIQRVAGQDRVQVIAVNIEDLETYRKIRRKMAAVQMLVASDTAQKAQRAYGVHGIPHMVIIGKAGEIMKIHQGYSEADVDDIVKELNQLLAQ